MLTVKLCSNKIFQFLILLSLNTGWRVWWP